MNPTSQLIRVNFPCRVNVHVHGHVHSYQYSLVVAFLSNRNAEEDLRDARRCGPWDEAPSGSWYELRRGRLDAKRNWDDSCRSCACSELAGHENRVES